MGNPVEPRAQLFAITDEAGLFHKDEERGLKRVFRVSRVMKNPPTDRENHGPVAGDSGFKGRFVAILD